MASLAAGEAVAHADGRPAASRRNGGPVLSAAFRTSGSIPGPEMSQTGRTVPDMNEPLSRYTVTVTVGCDGGYLPDPAAFAAAAARRPGAGPRASSARTWLTQSSAWSRSLPQTGTPPWPSPGPSSPTR